VPDWAQSLCPTCGKVHREVVCAFPPPMLLRPVIQKACADGARCVLVATVAVLAPHWHKLLRASVLPQALFPDGFARIRKQRPLLLHIGSFNLYLSRVAAAIDVDGGGDGRVIIEEYCADGSCLKFNSCTKVLVIWCGLYGPTLWAGSHRFKFPHPGPPLRGWGHGGQAIGFPHPRSPVTALTFCSGHGFTLGRPPGSCPRSVTRTVTVQRPLRPQPDI
jgi:hypothetical protein